MSLSRWLKVYDDLSSTNKELKKNISMTFATLRITKFDVKHQAERILKRKKVSLKALETYMLIQETMIFMRNKISEFNVKNGNNKTMAHISFLKDRSEFLTILIEAQLDTKETLHNLCKAYKTLKKEDMEAIEEKIFVNSNDDYFSPENIFVDDNDLNAEPDDSLMRCFFDDMHRDQNIANGVRIGLLNHSELENLKKELADIKIKIFDLKNIIAKKNAKKLTLEIPVEVAKFFTR